MYDIVYHVIAHFFQFAFFSVLLTQSLNYIEKQKIYTSLQRNIAIISMFSHTHTHSVCTRLGRPFSGQIDCGIVYCQGEQDPRKFSCIALVYRVCTHQIFQPICWKSFRYPISKLEENTHSNTPQCSNLGCWIAIFGLCVFFLI